MLPLMACGDLAKVHLLLDKILTNPDSSSPATGKAFNLSCNTPEKDLDDLVASKKGNGQMAYLCPRINTAD